MLALLYVAFCNATCSRPVRSQWRIQGGGGRTSPLPLYMIVHFATNLVEICIYWLNYTIFGVLILGKIIELLPPDVMFKAKMHQI